MPLSSGQKIEMLLFGFFALIAASCSIVLLGAIVSLTEVFT